MSRSTFSMTMMASSTTIPMAKTNPKRVRVFMEKPSTSIPAKAPMIETGTARHGINVALKFFKNKRTTKKTKMKASTRVFMTSFMEFCMKRLVSKATLYPIPLGNDSDIFFSLVVTFLEVSRAFAPGAREIIIGTDSLVPLFEMLS